jgi:hypothetical protein
MTAATLPPFPGYSNVPVSTRPKELPISKSSPSLLAPILTGENGLDQFDTDPPLTRAIEPVQMAAAVPSTAPVLAFSVPNEPRQAQAAREAAGVRVRTSVTGKPASAGALAPVEAWLTSVLSAGKKKVLDALYTNALREQADRLSDLFSGRLPIDRKIDDGSTNYHRRNAITHAYVSAALARDHGPLSAWAGGTGLEYANMIEHVFEPRFPDQHPDSWKDQWNNAIGRQIGEHVRKNKLSQRDLEQLILEAWERGDLIRSIHDNRIPRNASGWPHSFPLPRSRDWPKWEGPSQYFRSMPGAGIAKTPTSRSPTSTPRSLSN